MVEHMAIVWHYLSANALTVQALPCLNVLIAGVLVTQKVAGSL